MDQHGGKVPQESTEKERGANVNDGVSQGSVEVAYTVLDFVPVEYEEHRH